MVESMPILWNRLRSLLPPRPARRNAAAWRRAISLVLAVSVLAAAPGVPPLQARETGPLAAAFPPDPAPPTKGLAAAAAPAAIPPPPGLISWWTADSTATDLMDRNSGRFQGAVSYVTGKVGAAILFPGKDAALVALDEDGSGLSLTDAFTIDAWVFRSANQSGEQVIAGKAAAYSLSLEDGKAKAAIVSDTLASYAAVADSAIPLDTWTHLAAIYDRRGGSLKVYVNGEAGGLTRTGDAAIVVNRHPFNIGGLLAPGSAIKPARFFEGRVDEVDLFGRALTDAEIAAIAGAGTAGKEKRRPGLVSWWPAEGDGADRAERHPVQLQGAATFADGKAGQAFGFNGREGAAVVPPQTASPLLNIAGSFTLDAWVYRATNQSGQQWIAGKERSYWLTLENGHARAGFGSDPAAVTLTGSAEIPVETWTHLAAVYGRGAGELRLYVDGRLDGQQAAPDAPVLPSDLPFTLGGRAAGGGLHLNGRIDEASLYDRALSAQEIAAIAAAGSVGKTKPLAGLLNWWTADNTVRELINGLLAQWQGTAAYAVGKLGAAYQFNGRDTVFVVTPPAGGSNLDTTADFTLDAWVRRDAEQQGRQTVVSKPASIGLGIQEGKASFVLSREGKPSLRLLGSTAIPVGVWTHLAAAYDRTAGQLLLYVNGVQEAEAATEGAPVLLNDQPLVIGGLFSPNDAVKTAQLFQGRIDEIGLYGRALTPQEIAALTIAEQVDKRWYATAPGAVRWWPGEGDVRDTVAQQPGTAVGDVSFVPGKVGRALRFNGVGAAVVVASPEAASQLDLDNDFTIEAWVLRGAEQAVSQVIAGKMGSYNFGVLWGKPRILLFGNPPIDLIGTAPLPLGVWTHVAATYDRTAGQLRLYVNGRPDTWRDTGKAPVSISKHPLLLGGMYSPTGAYKAGGYFDGGIDELGIYRRALSAGEVYTIWAAGSRGKLEPVAGPVGLSWWPGDGNATDVTDRNQGDLVGRVAFTAGKVGRAFRFNGKDAAVVIPDRGAASGLSLEGSFSVEGWVMRSTGQSGRQWVAGKARSYGLALEDGAPVAGIRWDTPGAVTVTGQAAVPVGVWTHLAAVHDRKAGELRLYVNGALEGVALTGGVPVNLNGLPFLIGGQASPQGGLTPGQFLEGRVNEVSLFDRALSAEEVGAIVAADRAGRRKPGYRAAIAAPGVPSTWQLGETKSFNVIVENSGTLAWNASGANAVALNAFFLQPRTSTRPGDNWTRTQKVGLPADLPPGGRVTLKVSLTAPAAACCERIGFQMVKEGAGPMSSRTDVPVTLKAAGAAVDATEAPGVWVAGRPRTFNLSVTNTGKTAWETEGAKRVTVRARFGDGAGQVRPLPAGGVPAGQSRTFPVTLTPDGAEGETELLLEMTDGAGAALPGTAVRRGVTVYATGMQASIQVSGGASAVPNRWVRSQTQTLTVTVRNAGGDSWSSAGANPMQLHAFFLSGPSQAVGENWVQPQTVDLPGGLGPGESATLTFKMTAPQGYCCTKLGFQMVRKGIDAIPDRVDLPIRLD